KVCLPVVATENSDLQFYNVNDPDKDLERGLWGIYQPDTAKCERAENNDLNTVIVPALGFSESGDRLGRGKGFYDRWLSSLDDSVLKIGFSFREQILSDIFSEPHDIRMDAVITPDNIIMIKSAIKNQESRNE
ncbi:MAG: 5-formyltetrahydrofolate cyclo-ligase, partial [Candidatus Omnitrophica bacterium]|nr:5-formyltetrahydrofolate cyclo-ligase [Candidatus Omnitrophota bacterium]